MNKNYYDIRDIRPFWRKIPIITRIIVLIVIPIDLILHIILGIIKGFISGLLNWKDNIKYSWRLATLPWKDAHEEARKRSLNR